MTHQTKSNFLKPRQIDFKSLLMETYGYAILNSTEAKYVPIKSHLNIGP